jgi:hypothetical protein
MSILNYIFDFETNIGDLVQFNWCHMRKSKASQRNRLIFLGFFLVVWAVLFRNPTTVLIATLIFAFFMYLAAPILLPLQVYFTYKRKQCKQMIGKMHVEFNNECIKEKTEVSESRMEWNSINSIIEGKKHFFVYNSSISALIIPKMVFTDRTAMTVFLEQVKEKIKMNKREECRSGIR